MFKINQTVVVLHAQYGGYNECGTIVKKGQGPEYIGKWWVDLGYTHLPVEPERIIDAETFWKIERDKHNAKR